MTDNITKLPDNGVFTLKDDTHVDGADLQRFVDAGGTIVTEGHQVIVENAAFGGSGPTYRKTLSKTSKKQTTTIEGSPLTVPAGTEITGARPDGNGGTGHVAALLPKDDET